MPKRGEYNFDRLYKVRSLLDCILEHCRTIEKEEAHSIDEQIVPTKSKSSLRQYLPNKQHKWVIKIWARCGVSGMVCDCSACDGQEDATDTSIMFCKIGAVVIRLVEILPKMMAINCIWTISSLVYVYSSILNHRAFGR